MSRTGKMPIGIPEGVKIEVSNGVVSVKGPKGELSRSLPAQINIVQDGNVLTVTRENDEPRSRALHGLSRTLIYNMVKGVTDGYQKELEIVGVGYRVQMKAPTELDLSLGFSHQVNFKAPEGISFEVPQPTRILVKGIDKEKVGQVAANIRKLRKPEPYKGKGIKYIDEKIIRKVGKAGK